MRERSVYSINQRRRLEAETTHEREERLQQLSDNQQITSSARFPGVLIAVICCPMIDTLAVSVYA